jgi:hypothetical protein
MAPINWAAQQMGFSDHSTGWWMKDARSATLLTRFYRMRYARLYGGSHSLAF